MNQTKWPIEKIPDEDLLFCFVHKQHLKRKEKNKTTLSLSAFSNTPKDGGNKSTDWSKYSSPDATLERVGTQKRFGKDEYKDPANYTVIEMNVGDVRRIQQQIVEHDPIQNDPNPDIQDNRAHSIIIGDKEDLEILNAFNKIYQFSDIR